MSVGLVVGLRHAVQVDQAGRLALRRHPPGDGDVVAGPHHRRRGHPDPVPPHDRHRADAPRGDRHRGPGHGESAWSQTTDRGRQHGLHLAEGQRRGGVPPHDAVLRDVRQPGALPRRLDCGHHASGGPLADGAGEDARERRQRLHLGALQPRRTTSPRTTTWPPRIPDKFKELQELFLVEATKYHVFPLDNSVLARIVAPRPSATAGRDSSATRGPMVGLPLSDAPQLLTRSFTITADVGRPEGRGRRGAG